jgi:hypothetical protein
MKAGRNGRGEEDPERGAGERDCTGRPATDHKLFWFQHIHQSRAWSPLPSFAEVAVAGR